MKIFTEKFVATLVVLIVLNQAFQYWYYHMDGISMNPAVTYAAGVDPMNLKLEKTSYKAGELVQYQSAFCKHRRATAVVQWTLVDGEYRFYSARSAGDVPIGCYPQEGGTSLFPLETLFDDVRPGCDYYFTGTIIRTIDGGRNITSNLKTQKFCVTK